jgi:parallel beta-helix repeat protein
VTKTNGIQINAAGVTLELNGFEISRTTGSGGNGIEISATSHRSAVRNGSIKGFSYGVHSLRAADYASGCAFRDLGVSGCTNYGILAGNGAVLEACRAHDNAGSGIFAGPDSSLSNCSAHNNATGNGIQAFSSSLINCTASSNVFGMILNSASATNGVARANTADGILSQGASNISNCTASDNSRHGIYVADFDRVVVNHCAGNALSGIFEWDDERSHRGQYGER